MTREDVPQDVHDVLWTAYRDAGGNLDAGAVELAREVVRLRAKLQAARDALERASHLVPLVTVRAAIEAGDEAIDAAGLNPWCINEGLADGSEHIGSPSWLLDALDGGQ